MITRPANGDISNANLVALLSAGLDLLEEGFAIFDRNLVLLSRNALFCKLRGYPASVCQPGATMDSLLRYNAERGDYLPEELEESISRRKKEIAEFAEREVEYQVPNGSMLHIRYQPIGNEGLLLTYRDITDIRQAEAALKKSEQRHALVTEAATEGIYDWDTLDNTLYVSPRLNRIFDFKDNELRSERWNARVHPEDYERYRSTLRRYFKNETDRFEVEYRIRDQHDRYRWVRDHAIAERDDTKRAIRLVGAVEDISQEKQAQEDLQKSEERHALAMDAIGEGLYDWDIAADSVYFSSGVYRLTNTTPDEMQTTADWLTRIHPDDLPAYNKALKAHFRRESDRFEAEYRFQDKNGTWRWASQHGLATWDENGQAIRLVGSTGDITDRKELEEALRASEERYEAAMDAIGEGVFDWNLNTGESYFSPRMHTAMGLPQGSLKKPEDWDQRIHPEDAGLFREALVAHFKGETERFFCEYRYRTGNDSWYWARQQGAAIRDESGRAYRFIGSATDITEEREISTQLEDAQTRLTDAIESISEGFVLFDADDNVVLCNDVFRDFFKGLEDIVRPGIHFEEFIRAGVSRDLFPGARNAPEEWINTLLANRINAGGIREQHMSGDLWLQVSDHRTGGGGLVSVYTDISEQKRRQIELTTLVDELAATRDEASQARAQLTDAIEAIDEGFVLYNAEDRLVTCNSRFRDFYSALDDIFVPGLEFAEFLSTGIERRAFPEDYCSEEWLANRLKHRGTEHDVMEARLNDGRWVRISEQRTQDGGLVTLYTDISAMKHREDELATAHEGALQAQTQLQEAIEAISEGFIVFDKHRHLVLCNSTYRNYYAEAVGQDVADLVVPGAYQLDFLAAAFEAGMFPDFEGTKEDYIAQRKQRQTELRRAVELRFSSGKWVQINERPTHDGGFAAVYTDITAMKERAAELAKAHDAAMEATRTKSQFLANMSHELRTPLNAIIGLAEMLHEDAEDMGEEDFIEPLGRINRAGKHLLELINQVLDLSKIEAGKIDMHLERFSADQMLNDAAATADTLAQKNGNRLERNFSDLGEMHADATRVRQIVFNLLSNACKFTENGTVTLSAERTAREDGDWLIFTVADSGIGMTEAQLERLFQEFMQADSSTTRKYGGTGLGLAISQRLARAMGGEIGVESTPDVGTTFTVSLPADIDKSQASMEPEAPDTGSSINDIKSALPSGARTVLVVDDDATIRDIMRRFLAREGLDVLSAASGEEALRLAREHKPAAITLDVLMPGMDGWDVLRELQGDPELASIPVVMLSMLDERTKGYSLGASDYMTKPIDRDRLRHLLRHYVGNAKDPRILVVEDDEPTRDVMARMLRAEGCTVIEAEHGKQALQRMEEAAPSLILLDLMMPEMDGFEFIEALRERGDLKHGPVIVVTAADLTEDDHKRLNGGVERILQKSAYSRDALLDELRGVIDTYIPEVAETVEDGKND